MEEGTEEASVRTRKSTYRMSSGSSVNRCDERTRWQDSHISTWPLSAFVRRPGICPRVWDHHTTSHLRTGRNARIYPLPRRALQLSRANCESDWNYETQSKREESGRRRPKNSLAPKTLDGIGMGVIGFLDTQHNRAAIPTARDERTLHVALRRGWVGVSLRIATERAVCPSDEVVSTSCSHRSTVAS